MTNHNDNFHFKEFGHLDNSLDADYLINSMDVMSSLPCIKSIKKRALETMELKYGDNILELGCGHGEDAEAIGKLIGNAGSVVAIDLSQRMINTAQERSKQNNVKYIVGDAEFLNYTNQTFSACHADRLLVSHHNYQQVFKEITRVLKPNGMVCLTEVDALSIIIYPYNDITKIILDQLCSSFVNPYIGRMLPKLFIEHGLKNITVIPQNSMIQSLKTLRQIFQFDKIAKEAIKKGVLTKLAAEQWINNMKKADEEGKFLYSVTFFTVLGILPI